MKLAMDKVGNNLNQTSGSRTQKMVCEGIKM